MTPPSISPGLLLPATIPQLLRVGSPVRSVRGNIGREPRGARGVVISDLGLGGYVVAFYWASGVDDVDKEQILRVETEEVEIALDLDTSTGAAHMAWWLQLQPHELWPDLASYKFYGFPMTFDRMQSTMVRAARGLPLRPEAVELLARLVMHIVGTGQAARVYHL